MSAKSPSCPLCNGGAMVPSTPLGTWRCPCGAALVDSTDASAIRSLMGVGFAGAPFEQQRDMLKGSACAMCGHSEPDAAQLFYDMALLHCLGPASASLLAMGTVNSPHDLIDHTRQLATELARTRNLQSVADADGPGDPKQLAAELELLRAIGHEAATHVRKVETLSPSEGDWRLANLARAWLTQHEGPRLGITKDSIPPGTELVDVVTELAGKWRPHT